MKIKIVVFLLIFINLFTPIAKAQDENFKQCFYIITKDENSESLSEDLKLLNNINIPIFIVIDPNMKLNKKIIDVLEKFQKEIGLTIILKESNPIEKSYFVVKGYDKKLILSGLCSIYNDKLIYIGENNITFDFIEIKKDPIGVLAEVSSKKSTNVNYALVVNGNELNKSTLILIYNEIKGVPLDVSKYNFSLKQTALIYNIFIHIGDITLFLFSISIIIFIVAIIIFKKWSKEKFLE